MLTGKLDADVLVISDVDDSCCVVASVYWPGMFPACAPLRPIFILDVDVFVASDKTVVSVDAVDVEGAMSSYENEKGAHGDWFEWRPDSAWVIGGCSCSAPDLVNPA